MKNLIKKIWDYICNIPSDKLLHLCAGALIDFYATVILYRFAPLSLAFLIGNAIAVVSLALKEYYDSKHKDKHSVEMQDFTFGLVGVLIIDFGLLILFI